jgi:hypothetical protein
MSEIIDPELDQDQIGQTTADSPMASTAEDDGGRKKGFKDQVLGMDLYNVMLLLALLFIVFAIFYLLGILRTYSPSFPFGGFPWNASEFQTLMFK